MAHSLGRSGRPTIVSRDNRGSRITSFGAIEHFTRCNLAHGARWPPQLPDRNDGSGVEQGGALVTTSLLRLPASKLAESNQFSRLRMAAFGRMPSFIVRRIFVIRAAASEGKAEVAPEAKN